MRLLLAAALIVPTQLFAAGDEDNTAPPKPVSSGCKGAQILDDKTGTCVDPKNSSLDVETIFQAVRQLAYAGRYADAQTVAAALPEDDDRRLTYMGFTHRKMGNSALGMTYYRAALERNPGNILARSYMGQGFVEAGDIPAAIAELRAIRAHGGAGTWAEASLRDAIATGRTYNY